MSDLELEYQVSGKTLQRFLLDQAPVLGVMGPMGSGKTTASVMKCALNTAKQRMYQGRRRARGAIIRNTYPELRTTTIKSWHEWFPKDVNGSRWQDEGPPTHYLKFDDSTEAEVIFLALDRPEDVRKLLSLELTWAYVNEAREIPKAIVDALTGRVGRFPGALAGGCVDPQVIMDTNAMDADHWWYRMAEEEKPQGWHFFTQPGGRSEHAENLAWLNQTPETIGLAVTDPRRLSQGRGYYERLVAGKSADWIRIYVDAQYGFVTDGKPVYPEYVDAVHCKSFELTEMLPIAIGIDFGLTPAAVVCQRDRFHRWRVRTELVTDDMGATEFGRQLSRLLAAKYDGWEIESITGDPAGSSRAQTDEHTVFQVLKGAGIEARPASSNDFILRRDAVAQQLTRSALGEPGLLIHPDCRILRKAMAGGYCLKRVGIVGQERYKDIPDKNSYSHVAEALQYALIGAGEGRRLIAAKKRSRRDFDEPREHFAPQGSGAWMG